MKILNVLYVAAAGLVMSVGGCREEAPSEGGGSAAAGQKVAGAAAGKHEEGMGAAVGGAGNAGNKDTPNVAAGVDVSAIRLGVTDVIAKPAGTIRLATYNLENLYDAKADGNSKTEDEKPAAHRAAAAEVIRRVNADVLALQEVESKEALTAFRDEYLKDLGYTYISSLDAGDGRGIEQSVLSRFPLSGEKNWLSAPLQGVHLIDKPNERVKAGTPLVLKRSPLRVTVTVPAETGGKPYAMTLLVLHHKAGRDFGYLRTAEAQFVVKQVREELKGDSEGQIVVLGDFNSMPRDEAIAVYTSAGLIDVMGDRTTEAKFHTHQSGRAIDHIFMTGSLHADVVRETRFILGTPLKGQKGDWDTMPYPAGYASDHLMVVVDLRKE